MLGRQECMDTPQIKSHLYMASSHAPTCTKWVCLCMCASATHTCKCNVYMVSTHAWTKGMYGYYTKKLPSNCVQVSFKLVRIAPSMPQLDTKWDPSRPKLTQVGYKLTQVRSKLTPRCHKVGTWSFKFDQVGTSWHHHASNVAWVGAKLLPWHPSWCQDHHK